METSGTAAERVTRLDAHRVAVALREQAGVRLTVLGPCPGGEVGAAYVAWPDGHRSVLTWRPGVDLAAMRGGPLAVVEALRSTGYPAPATELSAQLGTAVVVVQELLPGDPVAGSGPDGAGLDGAGLDRALALNRAQAGVLAGLPSIPLVPLYLGEDGPGFCRHEPLRSHSRRTAALERWIRAVAAEHPDPLPGQDAVHMDFHPGNLLAVGGAVSGVVDWDGAGRGDRRFDLVTLRFGVHTGGAAPGIAARLDAVLDTFPAEVLRPAWAHMSLRMTDWSIRHYSAGDVEHCLDLVERRVD